MTLLSSTTLAAAVGALGTSTSSTIDSVWTFALVALAIPLAFYIIGRIFGLFPGRRGRHN